MGVISGTAPPSLPTLMQIANNRDLEKELVRATAAPASASSDIPWAAVLAEALGRRGRRQLQSAQAAAQRGLQRLEEASRTRRKLNRQLRDDRTGATAPMHTYRRRALVEEVRAVGKQYRQAQVEVRAASERIRILVLAAHKQVQLWAREGRGPGSPASIDAYAASRTPAYRPARNCYPHRLAIDVPACPLDIAGRYPAAQLPPGGPENRAQDRSPPERALLVRR